MNSQTPVLDAHRLRLARSFADFVTTLGPRQVLEIGPGDGAVMHALRAEGRLVRGVEIDPARVQECTARGLEVVLGDGASLEDEDASVDVVVVREVLSSAGDPGAVGREAWRVAKRCVVVAEPEYVPGLTSQAMMEKLDALAGELRFARGLAASQPLDAGEVLSLLPGTPAAVETRSFGVLTSAPPEEVDAIVARAAADGPRTEAQVAQAHALREDAARGDVSYAGSRVFVAYKSAPDVPGDGEAPDEVGAAEGEVTLQQIALADARRMISLQTAPSQTRFVAPNIASLAQAALTPHAWFRAIAVGETPVGFVMVDTDPKDPLAPCLWRFMVDARHQGRGAGRRALELVCAHFAAEGADALHVSIVEGPGSPRAFYEALGFADTGAVVDGETVLRRGLGS